MNQTGLNHEWNALAPAWIREAREGANPTRNGLLDPPMLAACGDVTGLRVLDCGCGEGRTDFVALAFTRILSRLDSWSQHNSHDFDFGVVLPGDVLDISAEPDDDTD